MATRRGGRKNVKKGVQFTVMVVGKPLQKLWVLLANLRRLFKVLLALDEQPSSTPFASPKF